MVIQFCVLQASLPSWILIYHVASSAREKDKSNSVLWLITRAGKMELSCPLGTIRCILQEKFPLKPYKKSFIDQACSVKMAGYWPCSLFAKKRNLANIQSSWPNKISTVYCDRPFLTYILILNAMFKSGLMFTLMIVLTLFTLPTLFNVATTLLNWFMHNSSFQQCRGAEGLWTCLLIVTASMVWHLSKCFTFEKVCLYCSS